MEELHLIKLEAQKLDYRESSRTAGKKAKNSLYTSGKAYSQ